MTPVVLILFISIILYEHMSYQYHEYDIATGIYEGVEYGTAVLYLRNRDTPENMTHRSTSRNSRGFLTSGCRQMGGCLFVRSKEIVDRGSSDEVATAAAAGGGDVVLAGC